MINGGLLHFRRVHHLPDLPEELLLHDDGEPLVLVILGDGQVALLLTLLGVGAAAALEMNLLTRTRSNHSEASPKNYIKIEEILF